MSFGEDVLLELHQVHKSFDHNALSIEVLRGIELVIKRGESLAITGASGAGKSTLLNIMGTLEPPTQGAVRFEGRDIQDMEETELCKLRNRDMGFVFQFHHLLPEFNAFENTLMPALIARTSRREAESRAEGILTKVGLKTRLTHRVGELSGGEQQRVAIARALVMSPKLLLADEPTGNLDMTTGDGIVDLLVNLNQTEGLTMVIVTHNQRLAQRMSRQIELVDGRVHVEKRG
jgi:lipoprotein-releasing system ATP-binding protein